jgi:hypothetical protein
VILRTRAKYLNFRLGNFLDSRELHLWGLYSIQDVDTGPAVIDVDDHLNDGGMKKYFREIRVPPSNTSTKLPV